MGEAKRRKDTGLTGRFSQLVTLYAKLGIDTNTPGFYDDPSFLAAERLDPDFLITYGEYVRLRPLAEDEIATARRIVPVVATLVCEELEAIGRSGRCVDASQLVGRCLERLGIWNYMVAGAMNASVTVAGGRIKRYFWVVDDLDPGAGQLGHVWISAPPFGLVDATFAQQGWPPQIKSAVPPFALTEDIEPAAATVDDMMAPPYQILYRRQFGRAVPHRHFHGPDRDYTAFAGRFPGFAVTLGKVSARYFPTGIRAADTSFEEMFSGDAKRFWNTQIAPALGVARIR